MLTRSENIQEVEARTEENAEINDYAGQKVISEDVDDIVHIYSKDGDTTVVSSDNPEQFVQSVREVCLELTG
jgi:hypothetical protein